MRKIRHPHCCNGFSIGDRVCHSGDTDAGVVVDADYHTFDDPDFTPRVLIQWEDGSYSVDLPAAVTVRLEESA